MPTKASLKTTTNHTNGSDALDSRVALRVLSAVRRGDFSARMPADWSGSAGKVAAAINDIIEANQRLEKEIVRLSRSAGKEGHVKRGAVSDPGGAWASTLEAANALVEDLSQPKTETPPAISAVAKATLAQTMPLRYSA